MNKHDTQGKKTSHHADTSARPSHGSKSGTSPKAPSLDVQKNHDHSEGAREDGQTTAMHGQGAGFSRNAS